MVFNIALLCLLLVFERLLADLDALLTEVGQSLDDVWIVILNTVWHLAVNKEGCQSKDEPLHLEILFDLGHLGENELEEVLHGTLLLEDGHGLTHVIPEAHKDTLHQHDLVVGSPCVLELAKLELDDAWDGLGNAL